MRFMVFGSRTCRCRDGTVCSETCNWRLLEDAMMSKERAENIGLEATMGRKFRWSGSYARARVVVQSTRRLVTDYRRDDPA